ncbi:hypothetical protein GCM10009814_02170 [Lapillicoccus jejuensis]
MAMVPGGGTWPVDGLLPDASVGQRPTGIVPLDEVMGGGVSPGEILALAGPPRAGVSRLAVRLALGIGRDASVCIVNGHLPTRRLLPVIDATGHDLGGDGPRTLDVASWMPLPDSPAHPAWFESTYDVVVVDCLDEMTTSHWVRTTSLSDVGRRLRECARRSSTTLIITGRSAAVDRGAAAGTTDRGPDGDVFDDVADVHLRLGGGGDDVELVEVEVRGGRRAVHRLSFSHTGVARLQPT